MRIALIWFSFTAFVLLGPGTVVYWVFPRLRLLFVDGADAALIGWQVLAVALMCLAIVFSAVYAFGILWLVCGRFVFRRHEVEPFVHAGPTTRLERWLVKSWPR